MNQSQEPSESELNTVKASLKVMAVLSIIANIILSGIFIVVLFQISSIASTEKLHLESGFFTKSQVLLAGLFLLLMCIGAGFGAFKMYKGKRVGLAIYFIANGLWVATALFFGSGDPYSLVYAGGSVLFLFYFIIQRKELS